MPTKGLAAVAKSFGEPLILEEMTFPDPGPDQVLVKIEFSGICHTDLHAIGGDWSVKAKLPFIPGHEGAGIVAAAGSNVRNLKVGDRVGLPWLHQACGVCEWCQTGRETLCPRALYCGFTANGTFAEYCLAPAAFAIPLPAQLDSRVAAPILCAGVTMWKALKQSNLRAGEWVVISGVGGLGHLGVEYARAMGLQVAAVDVSDDKLELAKKAGATLVVNAKEENTGEFLQKRIGGAHAVVVSAPSLQAIHDGVAMTRSGGTCTLVGLPAGEAPLPLLDVILREIKVCGSFVGTRLDLREALDFAAHGSVMPVITEYPFQEVNQHLQQLAEGKVQGRIVLRF